MATNNKIDKSFAALKLRLKALISSDDVINLWFDTPNSAFENETPNALVKRGELEPLWEMVYDLESGNTE